ncbi:MAG: hypothetical protein M3Y22_04785 [Pseudomonadota bacterium]|nr:hypothetical protein [Pseudomonadota bacterium]
MLCTTTKVARQQEGIALDRTFTASGKDARRPQLELLLSFGRAGGSDELSGVWVASQQRQPRFQFGDPHQRRVQPPDQRQQREDQRILLGDGQLAQLDLAWHPDGESSRP